MLTLFKIFDVIAHDVTPQLTQEGAESGGECIPVVS